jgi:hypothetical protein
MGLGHSKANEPVTSNVTPVFNENVQQSSDNINKVVQEISTLIGNAGFKGAEDIPNPESFVDVNSDNQLEFYGGTFSVDANLQETLVGSLEESLSAFSDNEEFTGGADKSTEVKVLRLLHDGISKLNNEYGNISNAINDKITTLHSLQVFLKKGLNKLSNLVDENKSEAKVITEVQEALLKEIDRQLILLQNLIKVNVKPTKESLMELLKKNKNFTNLAETLGTSYNTEEASDRLALVFTNISQLGLAAENVKEALKTLNISLKEYSNVKDVKTLESKIASVMKNVKGKKVNELNDIMKAINVLKNNHISHDRIVKCLENSKNCDVSKKGGQEDVESFFDNEGETFEGSLDTESVDGFFDNDGETFEGSLDTESVDAFFDNEGESFEGGEYTKDISRVSKPRTKSALSKRIKTYEQTMKELFKSFMNQVNANFKELSVLVDHLSTKVGSEISYDEDLKKFIDMFSGLNETLDNEKIFYALINLNHTVAGQELKNRFDNTLDIIIASCNNLKDYKIFSDISKSLKNLKENVDTYSDTVLNLQKSEGQKTGSNEEFVWTDNLLDTSFSINNIKLIKNSIKKLVFFGKVSGIKQNLIHLNKEHKANQEDYDKLLGKSIGLKLSELHKEYMENVDRLNDKTRGRGYLLEQHNLANKDTENYLPRGLVENIYKIQYEAKEGLYKTVESIDLYLMNFTEVLSRNPEAIMDLNKMLEQTEIIAKWFNKKSVDNVGELLKQQIVPNTSTSLSDIDNIADELVKDLLNLKNIKFNKPILSKKIKESYEQCKKAIDSIAALKNIISMFIHIGEKFGNEKLTSKLLMSPNVIYKNLVKYIWVSAFTMGYGTAGGNISTDNVTEAGKGSYDLEKGNIESFFNILFTTIILPLDIYQELKSKVNTELLTYKKDKSADNVDYQLADAIEKRLKNRDIFIIDDKYFILAIKAMVGKLFTVIDTYTLFKIPNKLQSIMTNPVRAILGANQNPDIIPEAIELYIRLPLLVEFYKKIFENGNETYKNNTKKNMDDVETIAYIPEIGTTWSGLIQCIFDESRYINQGIYNINNMKNIVYEINNIYKTYAKNVSSDKLVKTVVLDLIAEVNRRYGILKEKDIAEFYQIKKKYQKYPGDAKLEDNVNFDILDENNEYQLEGPSSMYIEKHFSKYNNESSMNINDMKLIRDFRNKIYEHLFKPDNFKDLTNKSFYEKIKYYKNQINNSKTTDEKFELIMSAIDQSSNVNSYNVDAYLLYNELVLAPMILLLKIGEKVDDSIKSINQKKDVFDQVMLINDLYKYFNDGNLFKIKMIANNKFIIDYSNLQNVVEIFIENLKYNNSKFRSIICKSIIDETNQIIFKSENLLLNIIIKNDSNAESYNDFIDNKNTIPLDEFNKQINIIFNNPKVQNTIPNLYKMIQFGRTTIYSTNLLNSKNNLLTDVFSYYDSSKKIWKPKAILHLNYVLPTVNLSNYDNFNKKSILQKFNMLVFSYINTFYNGSTKKIYSKLFNEFANKTMSSEIFELGGIPDLIDYGNNFGKLNNPPTIQNRQPKISNNSVLSRVLTNTFRVLLTRNLNVQLPIKFHLLENIADVSSVQIEKYRTYLPYYINYLEHLIQECLVYKKMLDNNNIKYTDYQGSNQFYNVKDNYVLDDSGISKINCKETLEKATNGEVHIASFQAILNNIMNGSRSLINDAKVVLSEINYVPQFGSLYDNFIKNFYNNNNELPYMPISIVNNINNGLELIPDSNQVNTSLNKYINYTNYLLNNLTKNNNDDINNYLWLKEQIKNYNISALSTNTLDTKKVNEFLSNNKQLLNLQYNINHINRNLYYSAENDQEVDDQEVDNQEPNQDFDNAEVVDENNEAVIEQEPPNNRNNEENVPGIKEKQDFIGGFIFDDFKKNNNLYNLISAVENQLSVNTKTKFANIILQIAKDDSGKLLCEDKSVENYNLERNQAIILNIIDLNVMPINIHALLREVPLINIYNYAATFDDIVKQTFTSSDTTKNGDYQLLGKLLEDPYLVEYKKNGNYINSIKQYLTIPTKNTTGKPDNVYLARPKFLTDLLTKLTESSPDNQLVYNNKFFRNVLFLVNLQRVIRLKLKNAVYQINNNVVSNNNLMNMRITEYVDDNATYNENEFEITDLI